MSYEPKGHERITALVVWGVAIPLRAWALKVLWGWFVVPLGVVAIGKAHALGISSLFALLAVGQLRDYRDEDDWKMNHYGVPIVAPLTSLLLGLLWHSWM